MKLIDIVNQKEIMMCGRFAQVLKYDQLQKLERELRLNRESDQLIINYNVAPTQPVVAAVSQDIGRYIGTFRWGLIPFWSQELPKFDLINIRSDSLVSKPSFRKGLQYRRCLIPANGFYEWRKSDKQPFFVHSSRDDLIYMAGIYDVWQSPEGSYVPSLAIITTDANKAMHPIHHRMPILLFEDDRLLWLDHTIKDINRLIHFLQAPPDDAISMYAVSRFVNNPQNNSEECIRPINIL